MRVINVKAVINKRNGQINFSLPKKKLSETLKKNILENKKLKINIIEDIK